MPRVIVGLLLDDGAREVVGVVCALVVIGVLAVFQAVAEPAILLVGPGGLSHGQPSLSGRQRTPPALPAPAASTPAFGQPAPTTPGTGPAASAGPRSTSGGVLVQTARGYLGVPYVFGGVNPAIGLDCSGLVQLVYRQVGLSLPRTAQQQYDATARVGRDELQPGDLVFFARTSADPHDWVTHVGIYIGNGLQINAPTDGQVVSIQPVFSGYWGAHYAGGGRAPAAG
jgi:cell wall-associated NlpC family hydrolase